MRYKFHPSQIRSLPGNSLRSSRIMKNIAFLAPGPKSRPKENDRPHASVTDHLRDFSADWRLLLLIAMALVVGTAGAGAAWALSHLINLATNLAYYGRFSAAPV